MIDIQTLDSTVYVDPKPRVCKTRLYKLAADYLDPVAPWAELPPADRTELIRDNRRQQYMLRWHNFRGNEVVAQLSLAGIFVLRYTVYGRRENILHRSAIRLGLDEMLERRLVWIDCDESPLSKLAGNELLQPFWVV